MTDDRADRIRRIRNRAKTGRDADDADDSTDEPEETESAAGEGATEESTDPDATAPESDDGDSGADGAEADGTDVGSAGGADADDAAAGGPDTNGADSDDSSDVSSAAEPDDTDPGETGPSEGETAPASEAPADGRELSYREGDVEEHPQGPRASSQAQQQPRASEPASAQGGTPEGGDATASSGQYGGSVGTVGIANQYGSEPTVDATVDTDGFYDADEGFTGGAGDDAVFVESDTLVAAAHHDEETVQVLEFFLGEDRYAIEIERISAIVEMKEITRFPRGPGAIDGVTDLRGEITAILDPTALLDIERVPPADDQYIVVLKRSEDKQKLGVRVSDVSQAVTHHDDQIEETAAVANADIDHEFVSNIIKKPADEGAELVAWLDMDELIEAIG
ncbi:chemotaxis protein CheW [Natrialbaceae archaeon GCM10025810]|uniref:chemotaxis protein CheW n=1 Tax=Halovalidus salilacus TaxID=3075124 RepID=UPI003621C2DD